jgi:type IVB pilus formation R64 PilN family outer membrane protein
MRFFKSNFICVLLAVGVLALSGCSITKENDAAAEASVKSAQDMFDNNQVHKKTSLISKSDSLYLSNEVFEITNDVQLPSAFDKRVVYTTGVNESVVNTYGNVAKLAGQEISVSDGARVVIDEAGGMLSLGVASYQGTFLQVLNQISNKYGLFWQYNEKDNNINIFAIETQVYELDAPLGAFKINNTVNSTSEASGDSGGSGGSTAIGGSSQMNLAYDVEAESPWSASVNTITNMLSARGSMTDNPVEGYVTVIDNPNVQAKIAQYVKKINVKNNKKIAIRIDVYDVETTQTSDYGLDVNALVDVLGDEVNIVSNSSSIFNTDAKDAMSSITFSTGSGSDHDAVFKALNTLGKTSEVTGATIYTISGQPAPIQSVLQTTYLASSTTTVNDGGDNTTTLEPGTVVTGYSMTVTPKIQSNNQILVNLNLQLSTLLDMITLKSEDTAQGEGGETIQGPEIHSKNFLENMVLESGQSLLIAGFQEKTIKSVTASPGSINNWVAGGSKSTSNTVTTTVIVVTPYVIGD